MIKKALIAAAALLALCAHAGYAQLQAPAGFGGTSGNWTYAAAANDKVYGKVVHQAGALTANVGGQAVKMPAAYRLAANAPRIAAAAIYLNPGVRTAVTVAGWLIAAKLVWDEASKTWRQVGDPYNTNGLEWYSGYSQWFATPSAACSSAASMRTAKYGSGMYTWSYVSATSDGLCKHRYTREGDTTSTVFEFQLTSRPTEAQSCPAGWTATPAGCLSPAVAQPQFEDELIKAPMPSSVPLELPYPTPLPIEQPSPWINPSPGENPQSQPLRVPTGTPVPIPNTDPQQYRQPYVDIIPAPTPDNPWRVDVRPGETTSTNPNPAENPQPDSQDKPAEEQDKSLCDKYPDIAACEKVEVTDKPLPKQPKLYEPKYPDGITGVWNSKIQEIKATPLFNLAPSLFPDVSAGICPSWKVDLTIDGWTNGGLQDVSPPCWVWDVAKLVIIASALLLARRLIFGG